MYSRENGSVSRTRMTRYDARHFVVQLLCFTIFFQSTGIANALPSRPERASDESASKIPIQHIGRLVATSWDLFSEATDPVEQWLEEARGAFGRDIVASSPSDPQPPLQVASFLPAAAMTSAFLGISGDLQAAGSQRPPTPPRRPSSRKVETSRATIVPVKATGSDVALLTGFNLISLPNEPPNTAPATVLAPIAGQLTAAFAYDACDSANPWKVYDPADLAGSDLSEINHTQGLWVDVSATALLPSAGNQPAATQIQLCTGWNLIGYPLAQPRPVPSALASIAGKYIRVFGFDPTDPQNLWEGFDVAAPSYANNLPLMQPGRGYWVLVTEDTTLDYENVGAAPVVDIAIPMDLAEVTAPTGIIGSIDSNSLDRWTLSSRPSGEQGTAFAEVASGNTPVSDVTLGSFDPTLLLNGMYDLKLEAVDFAGQSVEETISVVVNGQMKIGHFTLSFVDLAVPVSGLDIEVVRTYDSRDKRQGDFGIGWSLDIRQGSYRNNRPPGDGWQLQTGFLPCDSVIESKSHLTTVRLSDQEVYLFALRLQNGVPSTGGGCFADARFDYVDGPIPGATLDILGGTQVFWETGSNQVTSVDTLGLFEPRQVQLTTRDGRIFDLDLAVGVTGVEDLNGNRLEIDADGIRHSSGREITFTRDAENRITTITDPLSRPVTYEYSNKGDLVSFSDRSAAITRFTYDGEHRILDIENALGIKPLRNEYGADGRLVRHIDAFGKIIELGHDLENRREVVTNRLGASRVLEYDLRGNVVREIDELGHVTLRTFDVHNNLLSEADALGRIIRSTYTPENDLASQTSPLGHTYAYAYDNRGRLLTVTDPLGGVATSVYDSRGNLTQTTNALGHVMSFTYDTVGNLSTSTDALGHVASIEYDSFGNPVKEIDALGHETFSTYDAAGNRITKTQNRTLPDGSSEALVTSFIYDSLDRVTTVTAADGSAKSTTYDLLGKITSNIDELLRVTTSDYDLMGRLVTTTYPDGTSEGQEYDGEGRIVTQVDRGGRSTTLAYDAVGRLLSTRFPDGATDFSTYDDAGQLAASTDARGNTTTYRYDDAGRRTEVIDPFGNTSIFTYDAVGNQTAFKDAKGNTTVFTYDSVGRLTQTIYPDGTTSASEYDPLVRRISETDQAGIVTHFAYDPLGRLTSVTDALAQVTSYTYDEVGNRLSQTDSKGSSTRFEFDQLGRQIARILPDGARELMIYGLDGTIVSHTDFKGTTKIFEYDVDRRQTRRIYPGSSEVSFTYTPTGQRASFTDARGTTNFIYDMRDRLVSKTLPDGRSIAYTYDSTGNRISMIATVGEASFATTYTYDSLNRLSTITDNQGGVTSQTYDQSSNLQSVTYANSVATAYTFDTLNRLVDLTTLDRFGEVIQSYAFTLATTGHREQIAEFDGSELVYAYDDLYRLTEDRVENDVSQLVYSQNFTYDAVGNRVNLFSEQDADVYSTASTYDSRSLLLTEDSVSYSWDQNGNLISESGDDGATYSWDLENRLTGVTLVDGTQVNYLYDPDGVRVRTEVVPPGSGVSLVTDYLNDTNGLLSHVAVESSGNVAVVAYTRADDRLMSLYRPASDTSRYFHSDGLGSIRLLTDAAGVVTDSYTYTAFGEIVSHLGADGQPYLFAGEQFDQNSGLYYNRARWLDVGVGRFVSEDPFSGKIEKPLTLNPFSFALSDPVNFTDPTGEFAFAATAAVNVAVRAPVSFALLNTFFALLAVCAVANATSEGGGCTPRGGMRIQLQEKSINIDSSAIPPSGPFGVTALQVRTSMFALNTRVVAGVTPFPFPSRLHPQLAGAIARTSQWISGAVAGGGVVSVGRVNVHRQNFHDSKTRKTYRLDLENLSGHNLRR